jgi:hypothetical protein
MENEEKKPRRTPEMQLAELAEKKKQLIEKEKRLKAKLSGEERKKRTKRLIEIGAAVESVLGESVPGAKIEKEKLPNLMSWLRQQEARGKFFSTAVLK